MIELADLLQATDSQTVGPVFARRFTRFSYDSRLLLTAEARERARPTGADQQAAGAVPTSVDNLGPLFVAVKTEKGDGHDYVADAVARGATGVLCQRPLDLSAHRVTCIVVPDTRAALLAYARFALQRANLLTVAVTGSTGKTTAKEVIAAVLARSGQRVFRNRESINGRYGLSLTAGELEPEHRLAVLELAADSFGEIQELVELTRPRVGVLTAINEAHLATFGTLTAIADEKARLLEALPAAGLAVLNADDPAVMALAGRTLAPVITVGTAEGADVRGEDVIVGTGGLTFTARVKGLARDPSPWAAAAWRPGQAIHVRSRLLGRHQIPLLLSAVAVGLWFGLPVAEIEAALAEFNPLPGHLRPLAGWGGALILDDTVNASPAAMSAALDVLALFRDRPRLAVLGEMWDLGEREVAAHRQIGLQAARVADRLVVKGQRAQEIAAGALEAGMPAMHVFRAYTDAEVLRYLREQIRRLQEPGPHSVEARGAPVILVKGDRPARMERIVAGLLAEPRRAAEVLIRQSPGWQQVQPLLQDRPTWVELDLDAVAGNLRRAQEIVGPEVGICAVLKADGYGHGAVGVARTVLNNGARMLAVACLAEAVSLRRAAIEAPILVLGYTPAWQARDTVRHNVTATVYDLDVAQALSRAATDLQRPARVHVKVDTGMGRLGLFPHQVVPFVQELVRLPGLIVEGVFTHFSVADSSKPEHQQHTRRQIAAFKEVVAELTATGIAIPLVHAANSAGMLAWPESHFNMVRLGIALYGLSPSAAVPLPAGFRPTLTWKTQVAQVKRLLPGSPVSYGNTFVTNRETTVAVIPVGYADGFRRAPRHWGHVLVRGQRAPIVGRVCMDQTMVDVTDIPGVRQGDEVVLIGRQGDVEITVDQVAERLGTINYEVVSQILARVPRVV